MSALDKKLTRKEAKAQSRQRLIAATIDVLRTEGAASLTTGKVARSAGLSQPSFYVHFKDMEEALVAAALEIGSRIRGTLAEERRRLSRQRSRDTLLAAFRSTLNAFLAHPEFTEILLRYRRDPETPIGRQAHVLFEGIREDALTDCRRMGLTEERLPELGLFIELMLGMTFAVVEGFLDGRLGNRDRCAEALFRSTVSVYAALVQS